MHQTEGMRLLVVSPTVQRIPVDLGDAEVLQQSAIIALIDHTVLAAFHHHAPSTEEDLNLTSQPLFVALRHWLLWRRDGPWRHGVIAW